LRKRYQESLDEYFKDFTKIKLLAMGVNPLLATQGVADIKVLLKKNGKGKELVNHIKQCIKEMLMDFSKDMKDSRATANLIAESSDGELMFWLILFEIISH
jgi:hypothetical protein